MTTYWSANALRLGTGIMDSKEQSNSRQNRNQDFVEFSRLLVYDRSKICQVMDIILLLPHSTFFLFFFLPVVKDTWR